MHYSTHKICFNVVKIKCSQKLKFEIELKIMFTRRQALGLEPTGPKVATKTRKPRVTKTLEILFPL